uniref:Tuftelin-interacting protein 11 (Trinotate prediction) n=1 Tax=Henneguya salminicola TaxID=69463 RepID=A0A6G3MJI2_HENSL
MQGFLARSIRPKLIDCLQTKLIINPRNQILDPLMWILRWKNIMDTQSMAFVLSRGFSLKWLNVIHRWLSQTPNYEDVKKWYTGWKSLFIDYIDHPSIQFIFTQALEMIDFSMKGLPIPTPKEYTPPVVNNPPAVGPTRISLTFKEIIEKEATINGIIFTPTVKKRPDGKTIYHFGGNNIYIDRDVIFIEKSPNQPWVPISINNLISASSKM